MSLLQHVWTNQHDALFGDFVTFTISIKVIADHRAIRNLAMLINNSASNPAILANSGMGQYDGLV